MVVGMVSGIVMLDKKSELDDQCRPLCPRSARSELTAFRAARTVSAIGYGIGFLGLGIGAGLLLTAPKRVEAGPAVSAVVGLGTLALDGRF